MDRRETLKLAAASLAVASLPLAARAQEAPGWKNHLDAYSRTLHWLRTPDEVADACHQIGNTTIDLTVRAYPSHVQPEKVKTDLPIFYNGLKRNGITVTKIAMDVTDATTPYLEDMLATASSLGVRTTWWRGLQFDWTKPYPQMLDGLKPRVDALQKLLAKYNMKACWHPMAGFTEVMDLIRGFDPRYIAIDYDTGNLGQFNQGTLANQIRIAGPYVGSFVFKDFIIEKQSPEQQAAAAAARGPAPGAALAGASSPGAPASNPGSNGAPGGGRGAGGSRGGASGRGGGSPNGWTLTQVPVGTGVLNLPLICQTLKEINFQGPIECQPEWAALDGAGQGQEKLSIPKEDIISMLKRDYQTVSVPLAEAGVI